jgi:hypothetical protein
VKSESARWSVDISPGQFRGCRCVPNGLDQ